MFSLFFRCKEHFTLLPFSVLLLIDCSIAFQITGAQGGVNSSTGVRPLRYEIHDFANSGPAFDLFILALIDLQDVDQPYVALFEQLVWQHAQDIANLYPVDQRDEYLNAALTLRVPYWDWAVYPALPDVVAEPQISINTPNGPQTVENPLYAYFFQFDAAGNGFPFSDPMANFSETVRWWSPNTRSSNQSAATAALLANAPTIQSLTYQLFTSVTNYTAFSCTWPGGQWLTANNIESIHNSIHNSIGGYGHMQFPEVAGFDPVFWLHHANVDRLFAMWQALYPDTYIEPTVNAYGSYYEAVGFVDSGTTALAPFHSDSGSSLFTSNDVRSMKRFGYSYPELPDWEMNPGELAANVRTAVNSLYNPSSNSTVSSSTRWTRRRSSSIAENFGHVSLDLARRLRVNNLNRQWSITVLVDRFPLDTSFCIDFFMGDAPDEVSSWPTAPNLIGTYAQFSPANVTMLHPNGFPQGQVRGEISMTHTLAAGVSRGALRDLSPRSVTPLLRHALNWKARTPAGEEVPLSALSGLSISVSTRPVVPRNTKYSFPVYGAVQWLSSVTEGKPCGGPQPHVHGMF
ncbi:uncharacterized protein Z519_06981 [Cladophialophora bantiana CBS 173.52]|uniref:tyrosinase n=1 Tax=Cladophialophora bantiana (strain ATCC 10958 / CBS 173.52 / CDC B-1940 / NIH 8579) TaxID=1442370 RepID=A0A0D2I581_CLAB1|nr:uncharacterized protein Z519_06981 [Cladophialophora bantiana CBS 173.52]KIW91999.1 hypothetical protein Z519_06981 [Cladophialophora bantiana CBS 173.52]